MARPQKTGLDYFPLDCQMDDKVEMLEAEHGLPGFAVFIKLLQLIYQTEAGELDMSNVFRWKTLGKKWEISEETLRKLVSTMCEVELFDKVAFEEREILTSNGVQKRLGKVAELREKDRLRHGKANSNSSESFSDGKPTENIRKSTQSKRKEKGKNKEANASTGGPGNSSSLSDSVTEPWAVWLAENAPDVQRMKEPLTAAQYAGLVADYDESLVQEVLQAMHNTAGAEKKYKSANLTARNWCKRRCPEGKPKPAPAHASNKPQEPEMNPAFVAEREAEKEAQRAARLAEIQAAFHSRREDQSGNTPPQSGP